MFENDHKYVALAGDASSRRYWRVEGVSQILCHEPSLSTLNEFLSVAKLFCSQGISSPSIISVNEENQTYLQSDLGDTTLLIDIVKKPEFELIRYKQVIDELLKIQKLHQHESVPDFIQNRFFDREKFLFEVNMTLDYFGKQLLKSSDESIEADRKWFMSVVDYLCEQSQGNMVFVHRDFHSRNIMIQDNKPHIIDFQDARMGLAQYDLASLLDDCYYQLQSGNKKKLLKYYFDRASQQGIINGSYDQFLTVYRKTVLQRVFKAIGSFAYLFLDKSNPRYLKYIGFAVEKIRILMLEEIKNNPGLAIFKDYYAS